MSRIGKLPIDIPDNVTVDLLKEYVKEKILDNYKKNYLATMEWCVICNLLG